MKSACHILGWFAVAAFLTCGCFRQDIRTLVVKVPQMKSADCCKIIQGGLSRVEGINSAEPDFEKRTITVTYNSTKLSIKNIEFLIAGAGFDANDEVGKSEAKAALPPGCR
jgi:P-type Cu+ transporter